MYHWSKSEERLNRYAGRLEGESLSFLVHYWGTVQHLTANSIHRHSFYEICYVDGGTGIYTDGNQMYPLCAGVAFCTIPGQLHQIKDVDGLNLLFVAFEPMERPSAQEVTVKYIEALQRCAVWTEHASDSPAIQIWKSMLLRSEADTSLPASLLPKLAHGTPAFLSKPVRGFRQFRKRSTLILRVTTRSKGKVVHKRQPRRACVTTRSGGLPECVRAAIIPIVCGEYS